MWLAKDPIGVQPHVGTEQLNSGEFEVGDVERVLVFGHVTDQPPAGSEPKLDDASPVLAVSPAEWSAFTVVVKAGRLDG